MPEPNRDENPGDQANLDKVLQSLTGPGDMAAASLGFAAGIALDIVTHGFAVVTIGSAATLGMTSCVGIKKSIDAAIAKGIFDRRLRMPSVLDRARRLHDELARALKIEIHHRNDPQRETELHALRRYLEFHIGLRERGTTDDEELRPHVDATRDTFVKLMEPQIPQITEPPRADAPPPDPGAPQPVPPR